ncbi:MAG TPA: D-sedoheptulose 7-phosphate isomerase [Candidatus Polarisedimenticolaceae bacterium]|nr:D-sedoheptulose 7-phosphate isomerase [Candidatus Polarisedimenticolaceae bacterium]
MDVADYFERELRQHLDIVRLVGDELGERLATATRICADALDHGNKLLFFGNGGSAADAQHFAAELVVRYRADRPALAAIALTTDSSALTACANDLGYEQVFARQIEALGRPGDVAIGSSTSGRSPNVALAFRTARRLGLETVALTGGDGGELVPLVDVALVVPSDVTARIQEVHLLLGHTLCGALEARAILERERR